MTTSQEQALPSVMLFCKNETSDKVYSLAVEAKGDGFVVNYGYAKRGATLRYGTKTATPVSLEAALKIYTKMLRDQERDGYTVQGDGVAYAMTERAGEVSGLRPQLLNVIYEEEDCELYFKDPAWGMEEKYDGVRRLIRHEGGVVEGINKRGLVVGLTIELAELLRMLPECVLDAESVGDRLMVFDVLSLEGSDLTAEGFRQRAVTRDTLLRPTIPIYPSVAHVVTYWTEFDKREQFREIRQRGGEGVVFKRDTAPYTVGKPNSGGTWMKYPFVHYSSVIVAKVNAQRSVGIRLYDGTLLGNVTIPPNAAVPMAGQVIDVRYRHCLAALIQPFFKGVRDDVTPEECTAAQIRYKTTLEDPD